MGVSTYVIERYGTVRQRWQEKAETLKCKLQQLTDTRSYVSITEPNVAGERAGPTRVDELRSLLDPHASGRTAPRAAREELAEELNGLLTTNPPLRFDPALRFDPMLREGQWAILEQTRATEQEQLTDIGAQLEEAAPTSGRKRRSSLAGADSGIDQ